GALAWISVFIGILAVLAQSLIQFRRILSRPRILAKNAALLAILAFSLSFGCADVTASVEAVIRGVDAELSYSLGLLPIKQSDFGGQKTKRSEERRGGKEGKR